MDHPLVERINRTGIPYSTRREEYGVDGLGNEVFVGEEILVYDGEFYLVEELSSETIEVLERHGATYEIASNKTA